MSPAFPAFGVREIQPLCHHRYGSKNKDHCNECPDDCGIRLAMIVRHGFEIRGQAGQENQRNENEQSGPGDNQAINQMSYKTKPEARVVESPRDRKASRVGVR